MGKYGDLLESCNIRRYAIEKEKEIKERQEKIIKCAKLTKNMRTLATLLKDVENITDISMSYQGFTNCVYITFKDTVYNLIKSAHDINEFNMSIDLSKQSYKIIKYDKVKGLLPNMYDRNYREPMLSIEYGDDLTITKGVTIYITWTKEMNIDDFMEVTIKRLEDGYDI